jgi:hypothetical protein
MPARKAPDGNGRDFSGRTPEPRYAHKRDAVAWHRSPGLSRKHTLPGPTTIVIVSAICSQNKIPQACGACPPIPVALKMGYGMWNPGYGPKAPLCVFMVHGCCAPSDSSSFVMTFEIVIVMETSSTSGKETVWG